MNKKTILKKEFIKMVFSPADLCFYNFNFVDIIVLNG
jgi:hypothetical protein